jgi:peroxiredoxin
VKWQNEEEMPYKALIALLWVSAAPQFHLRDTQGTTHTPAEWARSKAAVLFFVTIDCPIGNSYVPEMNRIREAYAPRGIDVWAVQADPTVSQAAVTKYASEWRYTFPVLLDPQQLLVEHVGATITPQVAILSPEGKVLYLGRIDNRVEDFGRSRPKATVPDLRNALDEVLAGKPVSPDRTKTIGCSIVRKSQR